MVENSGTNVRVPTNNDPWSPVQQPNLVMGPTGAIPRTSPGIGLDNSARGTDLNRIPAGMLAQDLKMCFQLKIQYLKF